MGDPPVRSLTLTMTVTRDVSQDLTTELLSRASDLVPVVRARARRSEELGKLPDETMDDIAEAGFLHALTPKRWGGSGLGMDVVNEVARELARGDTSTAWTVSFLMEHNWMACRFPLEAQEELFSDRPYILAAAPLVPAGEGRRVPGGFEIEGTWRYASCAKNADWVFVTAPVEEQG